MIGSFLGRRLLSRSPALGISTDTAPPPELYPGDSITGGTLPSGESFLLGQALPPRWGMWRWLAQSQTSGGGAAEVWSPTGKSLPRALSRLMLTQHPNLARVLGTLSLRSGHELAVVERPGGQSLRDRLLELPAGKPAMGDALTWLAELAAALDALHGAGVYHLEVRPEHVFLDAARPGEAPRLRLGGFGAARTAEELMLRRAAAPSSRRTSEHSTPGLDLCAYLAPEQIAHFSQTGDEPVDLSAAVDRRTDVYALAALAAHLLLGAPPFGPDGSLETLAAKLSAGPLLAPGATALPEEVLGVLQRALSAEPAQRPPACGELIEDLRAAMATMPESGRAPAPRLNRCILVVAGHAAARLELQGLVTAAAPRLPVLTDGGAHGRTLALRYAPTLLLLHQPSLPGGRALALARELLREPLLRGTRMVAVVDQVNGAEAKELTRLGATVAPAPQGGSSLPGALPAAALGPARWRPLLALLRRLLDVHPQPQKGR